MFWGKMTPEKGKEDVTRRHPDVLEMSKGEMFLAACMNVFRNAYGFVEATNEGLAKDSQGNPLPLYTYPAIEYLQQFDYQTKRVFEFGAGASTLFWMARAKQVVSIENNPQWHQFVSQQTAENGNTSVLLAQGDSFPFTLADQQGDFDVIVVDGGGYRYDCAVQAVNKLAKGGVIILDNADWHHQTAAYLKQQGLLQVDMTGFKPCESHTSTTSLFLHREFDFPVAGDRQPAFGMGAKHLHSSDWDKPYAKQP